MHPYRAVLDNVSYTPHHLIKLLLDYPPSSTIDFSANFHQNREEKMQRSTLLFLSGLLLTAAFPQHQFSRDRRDPQILTPLLDQSTPQDPPFSEPYPLAAPHNEGNSNFLLTPFFPAPDTTFSRNNPPTILTPEPSIDTIYCTEKKVLVCCPEKVIGKYEIPDNGFLPPDCRLAAQYGVEFGKYPCRCCGGFFGAVEAFGGKPLGSNCVVVEGTVVTDDGGRGESEGAWY